MTTAYLNRIATAVPPHDMHPAFSSLPTPCCLRARPGISFAAWFVLRRSTIASPSSIPSYRRWHCGDADALLRSRKLSLHGTSHAGLRTVRTATCRCALTKLGSLRRSEGITHVIVTCCTGLYAPGLDCEVVESLKLNPSVERTFIGFMGCYAAINALKVARHIVRSEPGARVLLLSLELCSLHMQETQDLEQLLAFLVFADGCAAYLVSAKPAGLALDGFLAVSLSGTNHLITWRIGEQGFDMHLSGQVPGQLRQRSRGGRPSDHARQGALPPSISGLFILAAAPYSTPPSKDSRSRLKRWPTLAPSCLSTATCRRRR